MRGYQRDGPAAAAGTPPRRRRRSSIAAMRELARAYPETNATMQADVLPFWQAPRGPQRMLASALAILQGDHAAAAAGGLRQHREPRARARERAAARDRRSPGARRRPLARSCACCSTENLLLGAARRGARRRRSRCGGPRRCARCRSSARSRSGSRRASMRSSLAFAIALGVACGADLRRRAGRCSSRASIRRRRCDPGARTAGRSATAERADGRPGRAGAGRAAGRGALLPQLQRDARHRSRLQARRRAARRLRSAPAATSARRPSRDFAARLLERLRALPGVGRGGDRAAVPLDIHGLPLRAFTLEGRARSRRRARSGAHATP